MHDIRAIRQDPAGFDAGMKRRHLEPQAERLLALDEARRSHVTRLQELQTRRNAAAKAIGQARAQGDQARADELIAEVSRLKAEQQAGEAEQRRLDDELEQVLLGLPNLPLPDVPDGADESDNQQIRRHGTPPEFAFAPKPHEELGAALGLMDFETAAKLSGSRFVILKGALARLERALAQFMLSLHTEEFGFTEVAPPLLMLDDPMYGTAQLPKFADDLFRTETGHWLISTAEIPLTNLVRDRILTAADLPQRLTAFTPCFRSEAGAAGRDTRGMIRLHQFNKVELVAITEGDQAVGLTELERLTACAEEVLKRLELPYQVVSLCTGDLGFAARKTYDLEVWLPAQGKYREISSCSYCGDFQARRMKARYRTGPKAAPHFVHTLNGSGLAVGRALVAVMENYQNEDGSIDIPGVLQPFMGGLTKIMPAG